MFGLSPKLTSLLAIGSSICGVSAIIAAKGAIDADDEDASLRHCRDPGIGGFQPVRFSVDRPLARHERPRVRTLGRARRR